MIRGMRYSPVAGSFSVNMRIVSAVFIAEFHAMFVIYINSVSIGYGSPFAALAMTMCIMPCAAIGASHENALSMRAGRPSPSMMQIFGRHRVAERNPGQRFSGCHLIGLAGWLWSGWRRLWMRRLVAPAPRDIDRTEQHLQQV